MTSLGDPDASETASVRVTASGDHWVVVGEIDLDSVDAFTDALNMTVKADPGEVVLDMSQVGFMDSTGLRALLAFHTAGHTVIVRDPSPQVRNLLELTHLDHVLSLE